MKKNQNKKAVIIIDMLRDFVTGSLKNERSARIIPNLKILLAHARKSGWVVAYTSDAHLPGDPEEKIWGKHAMRGSEGAEVIDELKPQTGDHELGKRTYSGFHETGLDLLLRQNEVTEVIITGMHTNMCVRHTSADAFARNYSIIIPEDCVEAFDDKAHKEGLEYLKMCYGAKVVTTEEIIKGK
jgi:nicotinamidase-related amidase